MFVVLGRTNDFLATRAKTINEGGQGNNIQISEECAIEEANERTGPETDGPAAAVSLQSTTQSIVSGEVQ